MKLRRKRRVTYAQGSVNIVDEREREERLT